MPGSSPSNNWFSAKQTPAGPRRRSIGKVRLERVALTKQKSLQRPVDFEKLLEGSTEPIIVLNIDMIVVWANNAAKKILDAEEGKILVTQFPEEEIRKFNENISVHGMDARPRLRDIHGITWQVRMEMAPLITMENTEDTGIAYHFHQVSNQELAKSGMADQNFSQSVEAVTLDGEEIYSNKLAQELKPERELVKKTKEYQEMLLELKQVEEENWKVSREISFIDQNDEIRHFVVNLTKEKDGIVRIFMRDKTKEKELEEYVKYNPNPVTRIRFYNNGESRLVYINPAAEEVFPDLIGISAIEGIELFKKLDIAIEAIKQRGLDKFERLIKIGVRYYEQEICLLDEHISSNEQAPYMEVIIYTKDLTKGFEMNKALKKANEELIRVNGELDDMNRELDSKNRELDEMNRELDEKNKELDELATKDKLTGLFNYNYLSDILPGQIATARRLDIPITVVFADMMRFKLINDTFGHTAANECLAIVGEFLKANTREGDIVARFGGDEFVIVLTNCDTDVAKGVAAQLIKKLEMLIARELLPGGRIRKHIKEANYDPNITAEISWGYHTSHPRAEAWAKAKARARVANEKFESDEEKKAKLKKYIEEYLKIYFKDGDKQDPEPGLERYYDNDFGRRSVELIRIADENQYLNKKERKGGNPEHRRTAQFDTLERAKDTMNNIRDYFENTRGEKERQRKQEEADMLAQALYKAVSGEYTALDK